MKRKLEGKIAVITGGSSGIGLAISKRLLAEGVKIFNISLSGNEEGIFEKSYECDICDDEKVKAIVNEIVSKHKIDFLFCNAGMGVGGLLENASISAIDKIMNVNLVAHMKLTNLFIPHINQGGKIIFTGSLASIIPLPYQACYSASKAGIESFSRALATELRAKKIKVTTFMPCDVNTNFTSARIVQIGNDAREKKGIENMEKSEHNGASPDFIAKKVLKVVKKKNPPLRVAMGTVVFPLTGKSISFLIRILPLRFVNFLVRKIYL